MIDQDALQLLNETVPTAVLVERYPHLGDRNHFDHLARNRHRNGLAIAGAVYVKAGRVVWNLRCFAEWLRTPDSVLQPSHSHG